MRKLKKKLKVSVGCKMGWIESMNISSDWLKWREKIQVFYRGTLLAYNYDKIIIISAKGGPRHFKKIIFFFFFKATGQDPKEQERIEQERIERERQLRKGNNKSFKKLLFYLALILLPINQKIWWKLELF